MRIAAGIVLAGALLSACADDPAPAAVDSAPVDSASVDTAAVTVPAGIVSAELFQYRIDWAQGVVQARIRNDTDHQFKVVGVQFVWQGLTTPVSVRADTVVPKQLIDFPVTLVAAQCAGDGTAADMPSLSTAVVHLQLDDGSEIDAPVTDPKGVAAGIYLRDCERQMIDRMVTIEWADLHEAPLEGRPVTEGVLRLRRGEGTGTVTVQAVSNTILYRVEPLAGVDTPIAVLDAEVSSVDVPVRFVENRCDAHARAESSQSFRFFADIDLGDGVVRSYEILPSPDDQVAMRARLEAGCAVISDAGFLGEDP